MVLDATLLRAQLGERFERSVDDACAAAGQPRPPGLRLPPLLRETLVRAALLDGGALPEAVAVHYAERMPRLRVAQLLEPHPALRRLLHQPLTGPLPRLRAALQGVFQVLRQAGLDPQRLLGAPSAAALLAARPTVAALYAPTLHAAGLPLLGAYPSDCAHLQAELDGGRSPEEVIDLRLSGNLVHELCHGLCAEPAAGAPPAPWMIIEAAALHLGLQARPQHVFPDEPGEAVPGISLFVLLSQGLACLFGELALWRVLLGAPLAEAFPAAVAAALERAAWQEYLRRREPPFARDALRALDWIALADAARGGVPLPGEEDALDGAAQLSWSALPWWRAAPTPADEALLRQGVGALFQVNRLCPSFQTHPDELPGGALWVEVERCVLGCAPRDHGAFGEPARWLFPPCLARRLWERGARRVRVEGARRCDRAAVAQALLDLCHEDRPLAAEEVLRWTSSPR